MDKQSSYAKAGVDLTAGNRAVDLMRQSVRSTYGPEVLLGIGAFGGLYDGSVLQSMQHPVLVGSTDGVGTKTVLAAQFASFETIGQDIVNHCVNDILVQGAVPIFFLDYVAMPVLDPQVVARIVEGVAVACRGAGCAILGGETAEMPDVYAPGEFDLVGTIVGCVERDGIIDGSAIAPGDVLLGLPSSGLHTNGFTLVRRTFDTDDYDRHDDLLGRPLAEALLEPHRCYLSDFRALSQVGPIQGMAHITGGGFVDNIPRILPEGIGVVVNRDAWDVPALFQLIEHKGQIDHDEMYHVFNMGMGMVVIVRAEDVDGMLSSVSGDVRVIGEAVEWSSGPRVVLQ